MKIRIPFYISFILYSQTSFANCENLDKCVSINNNQINNQSIINKKELSFIYKGNQTGQGSNDNPSGYLIYVSGDNSSITLKDSSLDVKYFGTMNLGSYQRGVVIKNKANIKISDNTKYDYYITADDKSNALPTSLQNAFYLENSSLNANDLTLVVEGDKTISKYNILPSGFYLDNQSIAVINSSNLSAYNDSLLFSLNGKSKITLDSVIANYANSSLLSDSTAIINKSEIYSKTNLFTFRSGENNLNISDSKLTAGSLVFNINPADNINNINLSSIQIINAKYLIYSVIKDNDPHKNSLTNLNISNSIVKGNATAASQVAGNESLINLTLNNSTWDGTSISTGNSNVNIVADNGSIFNGIIRTNSTRNLNGITDITMKNRSTWNVTGDSELTSLKINDSSVNLKKHENKFTTIKVNDLSGHNSTYTFEVDIPNKSGAKLFINKSSDGNHIAQVLNDGSQNTNGKEKIVLIEDNSRENAKAVFYSNKEVEIGGYAYQVKRDNDNPDNWILIGKQKTDSDAKPTPNVSAKTITALASTSYFLNQAEMSTLSQRMGDLIQSNYKISEGYQAWGRTYGGNYKTSDNDNLEKINMNYYGFQFGWDINTASSEENKNYLGMFVGHTTGKPDYFRGSATTNSWYGGFYDTFIAEENKFYVDSVVKLGQYRNKYDLKDSLGEGLNGTATSNIITLSSQLGKRFTLSREENYNLYAEPQAQMTYSRIGAFNTIASNDLRVNRGGYNSTIGRLGILLGTQINNQSNIYLKTSYLHEFSNDVKYTLNDSQESYSVKGSGIDAGVGGNIILNKNSYIYAEADYINSKSHYRGSKFNVGYRYIF